MARVAAPPVGAAADWVRTTLGHLVSNDVRPSPRFRGTQAAADHQLATLDVAGYAGSRSEVFPITERGASGLSPYLRHGLHTLPQVWDAVGGAPSKDRQKFRDELLWQEYARHVYARLGGRTRTGLRFEPAVDAAPRAELADPWDRSMACIDAVVGELERDGWLVNQTRMWLASHWSVRHGADWRAGEDRFFTHLLDGSRAANRLGWQWTIGAGTGTPYGFSRWQVDKRAPGLCDHCARRADCPVQDWPNERTLHAAPTSDLLRRDPDPSATRGPDVTITTGEPAAVWITAESLGDADPALSAHADLPVVFVFDESLLARLRLSAKRLVFIAERLAELGSRRELEVYLGDPVAELSDRSLAATFAPVPGWRTRSDRLELAATHPWPWLRRPGDGSISSFSSWRKSLA